MYEIVLSCGHHRFFTVKRLLPRVGATIACQQHDELIASEVTVVFKGWTVHCEAATCVFHKEGFSDKDYAKQLGRNHLEVFPEHAVAVFVAGSRSKDTWEIVKPREFHQAEIPF